MPTVGGERRHLPFQREERAWRRVGADRLDLQVDERGGQFGPRRAVQSRDGVAQPVGQRQHVSVDAERREALLVAEVFVEGADAHARDGRDLADRRLRVAAFEQKLNERLLQRVGTRLRARLARPAAQGGRGLRRRLPGGAGTRTCRGGILLLWKSAGNAFYRGPEPAPKRHPCGMTPAARAA